MFRQLEDNLETQQATKTIEKQSTYFYLVPPLNRNSYSLYILLKQIPISEAEGARRGGVKADRWCGTSFKAHGR